MNAALAGLDLGVVDIVATLVKALSLVALLQSLGLAAFLLIYGESLRQSTATLRFVLRSSAIAGIALLLVNQCLVAARMGGEWSALFDLGLQNMAWHSSQAVTAILRVIALVCVIMGAARASLFNRSWITPAIASALISFPISGHIFAHPQRPLLTPLIIAHIVLLSYWLGGVYGLLLTTRLETTATAAAVANRFSRHAVVAVPFVAVAGVAMAFILLPSTASLFQPYGLMLLAKTTGFILLMLLAAANKLALVPALERNDTLAAARFTNALRFEFVVMVAVLVVTAAMTSWFSPE